MDYTLYIGNKNYSSWSMRPWILMNHFNIPFDEKYVRFDSFADDSIFKNTILPVNAYGTVPILMADELVITDSLAICEYLAETHPNLALWPRDPDQRAQARSLVAHMHTGYRHIRQHFPMNIEAMLPNIGQIALRDHPELAKEITFFDTVISSYLAKSSGGYLFGDFSIADAFYAPMCIRLKNYAINTSNILTDYIDKIWQTKGIVEWVADALNEHDFITMDEPYRLHP